MAYDVGDVGSGRRYLQQAMHLCQDIGDDALAGEMLAGMSHQAAFLLFPVLAIDLAQAAKANGTRAGVPALVSESAVMEAHGLALANDERGCLVALRESEQAFAAAEDRDRPEWLAYFDGAYLASKFGRCFRDLGRPAEAERFARRSLDMIDGYDRGRLFNVVLLASVLVDQRQVEEACDTAWPRWVLPPTCDQPGLMPTWLTCRSGSRRSRPNRQCRASTSRSVCYFSELGEHET